GPLARLDGGRAREGLALFLGARRCRARSRLSGARLTTAPHEARARPRVSVITVCRNARAALETTAESVLAEPSPEIEYWIVDGASTDDTAAVLARLGDRGARVLSEPDRGIADAMN